MPRSSRHKSSKHSSRDGRDYSDSEKESTSKDKKGKEESSVRVSKELGSGEKRKLSSHDGNGVFSEEYSGASKRRKDRVEDSVNDRWNGGEDDRGEGSQKSKILSDSKSKGSRRHDDANARRDESVGLQGEDEELKKSSSKVEERHKLERGSSRKEGKEGGSDKERKGKEGKSERLVDNVMRVEALGSASTRKQGSKSGGFEEECKVKQASENTELNIQDELRKPEPESQLERRNRRRRDGFGDGDNHQDDIRDINDRRLSSRDIITKDEKYNDEKHRDERYRDKHLEDVDRESRHRDDMQRDERTARERTSSRSDDKHSRDEKYSAEIRQKKSKPIEGDRDGDRNRERDRDRDRERDRDRDRDWEQDRERDRDRDRDWERERERERDRDRDRVRDRDLNHDHDRDRDHDHIQDCDHDHSHSSHFDDRSTRYKENRGRNRSPDDHNDTKSRGVSVHYFDTEKNSPSGSKVESDADRGRSQSRQAHLDTTVSTNRRRTSPSSSSHGGVDGYRHSKQEDWKYRDPLSEQRPHATSSAQEKVSKYRSMEKPIRMDDKYMGDFSAERSPSSKASPIGFMERSPSSTSIDRRCMNRSGVRQSLDLDETGRRSSGSNDARDSSANEDRLSRDLLSEKPLVDESSQADSSFYNRTSQSKSSSLIPPLPAFRAGVDSPSFSGLLEEDSRPNSSTRYKRSGDPSAGRGHGNSWKGVPHWSSPLPNAFIPFQHGPPHGGFPGMMPQFPSPPMFGVRPSMEMNHSGFAYHIADADRFPSHLRSLGWQNIADGSGPQGWDGNTGVFREEPHIYRGPDWDHNRHSMNGRGWETNSDMWKRQNGDVNMDLPSTSQKEDYPVRAPADEVLVEQAGHRSQNEGDHHGVQAKNMEIRSSRTFPAIETSKSLPNTANDKTTDPFKISSADNAPDVCHVYLSKLDISTELASSELYNQCMNLFNMDQSATIDKDITKHVNLEDGAIAGAKTPNAILSPLFPVLKDSIFQRAMDLYKKQSTEIRGMPSSNGKKLDIVPAFVQEKVEEQVPVLDMENAEEAVPTFDQEMPMEPILNYSPKRAELVSAGDQEKLEVVVPIPNQEVQKQDLIPSPEKPESPVRDQSCENSEEPLPSLDRMTSKPEKLEDADENCFPSLQNSSQTATILSTNGDDLKKRVVKTEGCHSCYSPEDRQALGDAMISPLFFAGGSPKACEALMPGSNESESVILSRIHHSPESTH